MTTVKKPEAPQPERLQPPALWKVKQVAAYLQMSEAWVYAQSSAGKLPCLKLGGAVRWDPEVIRRWRSGEEVETRRVQLVTPIREPK